MRYFIHSLRGLDSGLDSVLDLTPWFEINFPILFLRSANLHFDMNNENVDGKNKVIHSLQS